MLEADLQFIHHNKLEVYEMEYGYARVSTKEQNEQRQLVALREFGVADKQIFADTQSGKDFDRPNYRKLIKKLKPDDTLVVAFNIF